MDFSLATEFLNNCTSVQARHSTKPEPLSCQSPYHTHSSWNPLQSKLLFGSVHTHVWEQQPKSILFPFHATPTSLLCEAQEAVIGLLECVGMATQISASPDRETVGRAKKGGVVNSDQTTPIAETEKLQDWNRDEKEDGHRVRSIEPSGNRGKVKWLEAPCRFHFLWLFYNGMQLNSLKFCIWVLAGLEFDMEHQHWKSKFSDSWKKKKHFQLWPWILKTNKTKTTHSSF